MDAHHVRRGLPLGGKAARRPQADLRGGGEGGGVAFSRSVMMTRWERRLILEASRQLAERTRVRGLPVGAGGGVGTNSGGAIAERGCLLENFGPGA